MPSPRRYTDKRNGRSGWRCHFVRNGKRFQKMFPDDLYGGAPAAKVACHSYIIHIFSGTAKLSGTLDQQIREYLNWAVHTGKKMESTAKTDHSRLSIFCRFTADLGVKDATDITLNHMRQFQSHILSHKSLYPDSRGRTKGNRFRTWDQYRLIIQAFLKYCQSRGYIDSNIVAGNAEFKIDRRHLQQQLPERILSPEEIVRLLDSFDNIKHAAFFAVLAYTGLRLSEAMNLKRRDWRNDTITVRQSKSGKSRSVPVCGPLCDFLEKLPLDKYLIGDGRDGQLVRSKSAWLHLFKRALVSCEIAPARIHDLRHTFAAHLVMAGVDIATVGKLLGHSDLRTTMIYSHFSDDHLKAAISRLPF